MNIISVTDSTYTDNGDINLVLTTDMFADLPFTASATDDSPFGREVFDRVSSGEFGQIAPYATPVPVVQVPQSISPRQIRLALTQLNLREPVEAYVASQGQDLKDWWQYSTEFLRNNENVLAAASVLNVSAGQLDALWTLAATL